jgi:putative ABC transport system substrate-binding protein
LPTVYAWRESVEAGGLISYGTSIPICTYRPASMSAAFLKARNPGDLPVMEPTEFELVINLKTAKPLGLTIPETVLATADEVIQ